MCIMRWQERDECELGRSKKYNELILSNIEHQSMFDLYYVKIHPNLISILQDRTQRTHAKESGKPL